MVIAILFNRFAPSSRGLRRADMNTLYGPSDEYNDNYNYNSYYTNNPYNNYNNNRYTSQRLSVNNYNINTNSNNTNSTRAWSKIRNATRIASALGGVRRRRVNESNNVDERQQALLSLQQQLPVPIPIPIQPSYDDRYYALGYGGTSTIGGFHNSNTTTYNNHKRASSNNSISTGTGTGNVSGRTLFPFRFSQRTNGNNDNDATIPGAAMPTVPVTPAPKTKHRRKQFRAITFVTSVASDLDVVADWIFFHSSVRMDNQYKEQWYEQYCNSTITSTSSGYSYSDTDTSTDTDIPPKYMIPPILLRIALITCIVGSMLWLVLATDGQIAAPLCRYVGIDRLSMGHVLFACVLLEDIPQIILTITIEEYYVEGRSFSPFALSNIIISCYDMLIKLAEAYDDRNDVVETGAWCKATISKHEHTNTIISAVAFVPMPLSIPVPVPLPGQQQQPPPSIMSLLVSSGDDDDETDNSETVSNHRRGSIQMPPIYSQGAMQNHHQYKDKNEIEITTPYTNMATTAATQQTNLSLQQQQQLQQSLTGLMRFLTISNDKKIRLWETDCMTNNSNRTNSNNTMLLCNNIDGTTTCSNYNSRTVTCRKVYKGHTNEVTCITVLGSNMDPNEYHYNYHADLRNNNTKNTKSRSIKNGVTTTVSSVHSDASTCSHPTANDQSVAADTHGTANATLTTYFITGCKSGIAYLWSINHERYICEYVVRDSYGCDFDDSNCSTNDNQNNKKSTKKKKRNKKSVGKTYCPITSLVTIVNEMTFIAAYENGSIRLWDAWTGTCIGLFYHNITAKSNVTTCTTTTGTSADGHKILCCTLEDETLFVTGSSNDNTLHIWDTTSAMDAYDAYLTSSEESLLATSDNNGKEQSILLHSTTTNDVINEGQVWDGDNNTNTTTNRTTTITVAADACSPNSKTIPVSSSKDRKATTTTLHGSDKQYQTHKQLMSMKRLLQNQNQTTTTSEAVTTTGTGLSSTVDSATTCICCLDPGLAFITGSNDGVARLWSVQTGMCLRIFPIGNVTTTVNSNNNTSNKSSWNIRNTNNNNIAITSVRAVDTVTFLTGSNDSTIRLWDAISGSLVRTYNGHEKSITDIAVTDDDTSFITSSTDKTVKVWVLSAVSNQTSNFNSNSNNSNNRSSINGGYNNNINSSINDMMSINNTLDNNSPYYYYNNNNNHNNNNTYNENENDPFFSNLCHGKDPL